MKTNKCLYKLFQRNNITNNYKMKEFDVFVKTVESYRGRTSIHPGLVKANLTRMEVLNTNNPTPEENDKTEG